MASSTGTDAGKTALRAEYAQLRQAIANARKLSAYANDSRGKTAKAQVSADAQILANLCSMDVWKRAQLVLTYVSHNGEVDTHAIMRRAWGEGKRVAVPWYSPKLRTIQFFCVKSFDELGPGFHGHLEPLYHGTAPLGPVQLVGSICLVPGLVFDGYGNRIGDGGGVYDGFLAFYPGHKVGLAHSMQISCNVLPHDSQDIPVDFLVSDAGVWTCGLDH
ncbi:MAG: 5-formyltetrahydrofolate cyclo-ligase [Tractidigestivibacter sp.]|jgi:5-formyltetrahydrofolate cyclo-ligase|uniref:5-formyltetrahydrofolate cyclo-ligase n=1 Tax=Tractidigestivibacter sp. TaxID=2847320 RepID=UPI003D911BD4